MAKKKITEIVAEELSGFLAENGFELYNAEFIKEGKDWFLRVYIDKLSESGEEYVSTEDCEAVSRFLSERMDALDPIEQNYYLEVSSPGMDRELRTERDYERYAGKLVEVSLYKALDGKKKLEGTLVGLVDGAIVLLDEKNERITLPKEQAAKTNLAVVF